MSKDERKFLDVVDTIKDAESDVDKVWRRRGFSGMRARAGS